MRIGIDARELSGHPTGVGRYLSRLLREWTTTPAGAPAAKTAAHQFVLYTNAPLTVPVEAQNVEVRMLPGAGGTLWEQVRLPRAIARDRLSVFFAPAYTMPIASRTPAVVTIHDLSFVARPEWFTRREGARRRWLTRRGASHARAVITVSEFSRREIEQRFGTPSDRIHVIRHGIDPVSAPAPILQPPTSKLEPPRDPNLQPPTSEGPQPPTSNLQPRILYVGSLFNRRHVPDLIEAFSLLRQTRPEVELDIVGDNRTHPAQDIEAMIGRAAPDGRARWRRYVTDDVLAELYGAAGAFAFLSEYEGFGLTPLEAISRGVPPVLLDTAVARETCGDAALYVPPGRVPEIAEALERLLFDAPGRRELLAAAPAVLARYQWPEAARATLRVLETVAR